MRFLTGSNKGVSGGSLGREGVAGRFDNIDSQGLSRHFEVMRLAVLCRPERGPISSARSPKHSALCDDSMHREQTGDRPILTRTLR